MLFLFKSLKIMLMRQGLSRTHVKRHNIILSELSLNVPILTKKSHHHYKYHHHHHHHHQIIIITTIRQNAFLSCLTENSHHLQISKTSESRLRKRRQLVVVQDPDSMNYHLYQQLLSLIGHYHFYKIKMLEVSTHRVVSCLLYVKASEDTEVSRFRDKSLRK